MPNDKTNILTLLATLALTIVWVVAAVASFLSARPIVGVVLSAITLLMAWVVIQQMRRGVRPPTRWERFKAWMTVRPVLIGVGGVMAFMGLITYGGEIPVSQRQASGPILVGLTLVWAGLILYTIIRAPGRRESDEEYRKRMRYLDLD